MFKKTTDIWTHKIIGHTATLPSHPTIANASLRNAINTLPLSLAPLPSDDYQKEEGRRFSHPRIYLKDEC